VPDDFAGVRFLSEYFHVEKKTFSRSARSAGLDGHRPGHSLIPSDPAASLRGSFREWLLPEVFRTAVRSLNRTADNKECLTERQLDDLRDQIVRNRTLLAVIRDVFFWRTYLNKAGITERAKADVS
jgi:type I restriction enzyme R subunit